MGGSDGTHGGGHHAASAVARLRSRRYRWTVGWPPMTRTITRPGSDESHHEQRGENHKGNVEQCPVFPAYSFSRYHGSTIVRNQTEGTEKNCYEAWYQDRSLVSASAGRVPTQHAVLDPAWHGGRCGRDDGPECRVVFRYGPARPTGQPHPGGIRGPTLDDNGSASAGARRTARAPARRARGGARARPRDQRGG